MQNSQPNQRDHDHLELQELQEDQGYLCFQAYQQNLLLQVHPKNISLLIINIILIIMYNLQEVLVLQLYQALRVIRTYLAHLLK